MRLSQLRPQFYRSVEDARRGYLTFDCPKCPADKKHRFTISTFEAVPLMGISGAKRWALAGSPPDWDTVSLSPSIALQEQCRWHGFITNGEVA
jgi:hypothetical protein